MRQLLYIPDSKFITIEINGNQHSLEEYIKIRNSPPGHTNRSWAKNIPLTEEIVINAIINDKFSNYFYERYELDPESLTRQMFEVIDN